MNYYRLSWIILSILMPLMDAVKVSFYGASHIAMPLQEAKTSTNIRLRFRTRQENSLIFLAAGRTDYCLLTLEQGRIKFNFKIEDHQVEMWSPKPAVFNDLNWHEVAIFRFNTNLTMQIGEHFIREHLPPEVGEQNIHFGVFLGGLNEFTESYLRSVESFRGCISDVYYNNINIFKRARERTGHVTAKSVSWVCSNEFEADMDQSISFLDDESFMIYQKPSSRTGETWQFEFRTNDAYGTLLNNVAPTNRHDFMALEIVESKLRLLVGKGSNAVELIPDRNVSDGQWHNLTLTYSPISVEIGVDDTINSASFANGSSQYIELEESFYLGGFDVRKRKRGSNKGLQATESSLKGCMRNIFIDKTQIGLPNVKVTNGVAVECLWKYPCIEKQPCIMSSTCHQNGIEDFICYCDQAYCIRADYLDPYKIFSRSDILDEVELLQISPMPVMESDSVFLSQNFIDVLFDFRKVGIQDSGVLFHIIQQPKYGKVTILPPGNEESSKQAQVKFFSLIDLSTDKVKYTHNGMELQVDQMTIDLQLMPNNRESLPGFLEGKHRFVLHVNVTPVNDAPILTIAPNKLLRLTQGIPKILSPELLTADDPDSAPSSLIYTILSSPNSEAQHGRIELNGKAVTTFSQEDINQGLVTYLVNTQASEDMSFDIAIQVSDGMETSPAVFLRVSVVPLQLRMMNNTGLILIHKSTALITPWNLSFNSNSDDDNIDVRFDVVQGTQYGSVQKLRSVDSSWIQVDSFTSQQLLLGHIRYSHTTDFPQYDEFKFTASLGPVKTQIYDFRITFTKLKIGIQRQNNLIINGNKDVVIKGDNLYHQTTPLPTFARNIIYTVIKAPKYGLIYVEGHPEFAKTGDSFTQQEIDKNQMRYRTYQTSYSTFVDDFEFLVSVPECEDVLGKIEFIYQPQDSLVKQLTYQKREKVYVKEGDKAVVSRMHFDVLFNKFSYLSFNLTHQPKHGSLCIVEEKSLQTTIIDSFTLDSLYLGDVYYCHDDSESIEDTLRLIILSDFDTDFQFSCEVSVIIQLQNDNGPYKLQEKIFQTVRDETKIVTEADLKYVDPDMDTNINDIYFTNVVISNGEIFKSGMPVDQFSQNDIKNGLILFQHNGTDNGQMQFTVTDGLYDVPGSLQVEASDPFLKIRHSNASIVQEGKMVLITPIELSIDTNLNIKPEEIDYRVTMDPLYGVLKLFKRKYNGTSVNKLNNSTTVTNFTQSDIEKERLVYWNTEVASMDKIKYRVTVKGVWSEGEIMIRIYPAAYWEQLVILKNQTLFVEESTSVLITRDVLEIIHPSISPGDITYLVSQSPQHGYLEIQSITSDDEYNSKVFDQSTINSEKMFYIQAGVNQSTDSFMFDVTNGITWLRSLVLNIVIIPENLYIKTKLISVDEGKEVKLEPEDMMPFSDYYTNKILEYKIIDHPNFGSIKSGKSLKVNRFTQKQLEAGVVHYLHNGSENSSDTIKLVALSRNKESVPFVLKIEIIPINDEVPQILTNTGIQMWIGGKSVIKRSDLMVQDYDTQPENLTFIIGEMVGGYVAVRNIFNKKLDNFTQQQINNELIYFIHDSSHLNGKVTFYVTDGVHNTTEQVLHIVTNPVTLELTKNEFLHVFPLTRKQILTDQLEYKCSDMEREVKYIVKIPPQMGRLLYEYLDKFTSEISEFTQVDIENGRIFYEHTSPMVELKTNDSFYFDVAAPLSNTLVDQIFNIDVSVSSGGLLRFLPVPRVTLDEGDVAPIKLDLSKVLEYLETRAGIIAPELYIETYAASHGTVEMANQPDVTRFSLNDFYSNRVFYKHDHSDTIEDKIAMAVYLLPGNIFLCNITIPVTINPVNDQPFHLLTQSPHISVIEGENQTISQSHLLTEDADTAAKDIIYDIISGPAHGILLKVSDEGYAQDIITYGNQFSQADVNENRIIYAHSGKTESTTFYFKVYDGKFRPSYEVFNITILPITIIPGVDIALMTVQQGSNLGIIEPKHLAVDTNVQKSRLMYNITRTPTAGMIISNNKPILRFSQRNLEEGKIHYMQTDMTRSNDSFQVNAFIPDTTSASLVDCNIVVIPFILINPITIIPGDKFRISSTFVLDNPTQLKLNRYNPKIVITKRPKYGRIKKITRSSGDFENINDREISSFTFKELKSGVVYYVARKFSQDFSSISDSFDYVLTTKTAQPGQATVPIEIYSHLSKVNDSNDVDVAVADTRLHFDYLILVAVAAGLIVLLIMAIVLIKCRSPSTKKTTSDKDLPPSLPRPPDFMTLNNNRMYTPSDCGDSLPITASSTPLPVLSSIPHCKVIPIGLDNCMQDSENDDMMMDMNMDNMPNSNTIRYPYGDDNDDWGSSYNDLGPEINYSSIPTQTQSQQQSQMQQQQAKTNPLLRRNQYWV